MGLTRVGRFFIVSLFFAGIPLSLGAQNSSLAPEIARLEKMALVPERKGEALAQLARLYQLSGSREKALESWLGAAYAEPGKRDDSALLEAVKLMISMGEYDRAAGDLKSIILSNQNEKVLYSALYLSAQFHAFRTGDGGALSHFAEIPEYRNLRSAVFYTLWKISGDGSWKTRLLETYPRSPEARIAGGSALAGAAITPQWLLFPPREGSAAAPPHVPVAETAPPALLQTGLFGREDNARALAVRLTRAGYSPEITRRTVAGAVYWAVTVKSGPDVNQTIRELKSAGVESFPVN